MITKKDLELLGYEYRRTEEDGTPVFVNGALEVWCWEPLEGTSLGVIYLRHRNLGDIGALGTITLDWSTFNGGSK